VECFAPMVLEAVTSAEQRLLQRVADGDPSFRKCDIHSLAECERCDAEVRELQELERKGWVTLRWNHMSHHGEVYAAAPLISDAGRGVLSGLVPAAATASQ
jgi:hypothetical protein